MTTPKSIHIQRKPTDEDAPAAVPPGTVIKAPTLVSRTVKQTDSSGNVRSVQIETKKKRVLLKPAEQAPAPGAPASGHEPASAEDPEQAPAQPEPAAPAAGVIRAPERKQEAKPAAPALPAKRKDDKSRDDDERGKKAPRRPDSAREFGFGRKKRKNSRSAGQEPAQKVFVEVSVPETITVGELAKRMNEKAAGLITHLFKLGQPATINQELDQETAMILVEEMGHKAVAAKSDSLEDWAEEQAKAAAQNAQSLPRPPVVTVMGHVDHGKTSLLDRIRSTKVASGEAGGITQSIGAYQAHTPRGLITFIDTPGHAAFAAMRERGAKSTDIVILVVAADDGVMPQTKEAYEQAKAAGAPIVAAITKIDKHGANPDKARNDLIAMGLLPEDLGGDCPFVGVSSKTGQGIDELLERVLLQAEMMELAAPAEGSAQGIVLESRIEKGRGPVATVLVQSGALELGQMLLAGSHYGRVKAMKDCLGQTVRKATPGMPVQVMGLNGGPAAGSRCIIAENERKAKELAQERAHAEKNRSLSAARAHMVENLFGHIGKAEKKILPVIVKADSRGSLEALADALCCLGNDEVGAKIISSGIGALTENDITLAQTAKAALLCFNAPAEAHLRKQIQETGLRLLRHDVIYAAIGEIKDMLSSMLEPELRKIPLGIASIRKIFPAKTGNIAGCLVLEGSAKRNAACEIFRGGQSACESKVESLRRNKDEASEVKAGTECGIALEGNPEIAEGDELRFFETVSVARKLP